MMKFAFVIILFAFLSFASNTSGRKGQEDYWKSMMKDQPMPEAIKGLMNHEQAFSSKDKDEYVVKQITKNFDTRRPAIIYHSAQSRDGKPDFKNFNLVHKKEKAQAASPDDIKTPSEGPQN